MQTTLFDRGKPTDAPGQTLIWEDENQRERNAPPLTSHKGDPYSVLLLRPDHVANDFGHDTYFTHVHAEDAAKAIRSAQVEAAIADELDIDAAADYHPLLVAPGHIEPL